MFSAFLAAARLVKDESVLEQLKVKYQLEFETAFENGSRIRRYTNGRDSLGHLIVTAPDLGEAETALAKAQEAVRFVSV